MLREGIRDFEIEKFYTTRIGNSHLILYTLMSTLTTKTLSLAIKKMHWPIERNRLEQCEGWVVDDFCVFHHDSSKPWIILYSSLSCGPDKEISKENPRMFYVQSTQVNGRMG